MNNDNKKAVDVSVAHAAQLFGIGAADECWRWSFEGAIGGQSGLDWLLNAQLSGEVLELLRACLYACASFGWGYLQGCLCLLRRLCQP